jgi:hypothetical protein
MQASRQLKVLSVRLPASEVRRVKSAAAGRGITVQDAVHQALDSWLSAFPSTRADHLSDLQGSLADVDVEKLMREDRDAELAADRRR